jgi:hypothetical protein
MLYYYFNSFRVNIIALINNKNVRVINIEDNKKLDDTSRRKINNKTIQYIPWLQTKLK